MKIVVITNEDLKKELLSQGLPDNVEVKWQQELSPVAEADVYIDLLFNDSAERIDKLKILHSGPAGRPAIIIINSVTTTLSGLPTGFVRINAWNSFLKRPLVEAAGSEINRIATEKIFSCFAKTIEWVPDVPGFITARVISMIINEAYFTLEENVSTKDEIDTAMKAGTNYPYGPFEWGVLIGLKNVYALLSMLSQTNFRYTPSSLLQKDALV